MKRFFSISLYWGGQLFVMLALLASCQRNINLPDDSLRSDEIIFMTSDPSLSAEVSTKATAVTSLTGFNVSAVTGTPGSDTQVWTNQGFTGNNDDGYKFPSTGKWWPSTDPSYRFYASNVALSYAAGGATVAATNATDVICAYASAPTYKSKNTLSFEHIFARLGSVTVSAATGYTISNISIKITPKTGGTYNLKTGAGQTDGTGWSSVSEAGSPSTIASATGANANDIYLVPGTYTLTASWRAVRGDYTEDIDGMQCDVDLVAGKVNNISTTLSGNAKEVVFGVSLSAWSERNTDVTFPTIPNYLKFKFTTNGSVQWQNVKGDIQYSKNGGEWTDFSGSTVAMSAGDEIWFKGSLTSGVGDYSNSKSSKFITTGNFLVSGDVSSLCDFNETLQDYHFAYLFYGCVGLDIDSSKKLLFPATTLASFCYGYMFQDCTSLTSAPSLPATTLASFCYGYMFFGCTSLTSAPALPTMTLAQYCYYSMFQGCTSLTSAPALPATTLANYCYGYMFYGCTSLTSAPALPATTLADNCYSNMFSSCTSLTSAPSLPATTLASYCYNCMFYGCTSLTSAPTLPATTLANYCYSSMFKGCTSLTVAPSLPATTLASFCYNNMFQNCSALNYIKALFTTTPTTSYTQNWVSGVAATGTFVKADGASWDVTGNYGVPSGWTVIRESEE